MKKMEHVSGREETGRRRRQEGRAHNKEGVRKKGGLTEDGQKLRKEKKWNMFQEGRRQDRKGVRKEGDRTKKVSGRKETESNK